jgi:hypothetical protein
MHEDSDEVPVRWAELPPACKTQIYHQKRKKTSSMGVTGINSSRRNFEYGTVKSKTMISITT